MSVKQAAKRIYIRTVENAMQRFSDQNQPKEGWLVTMRKALGMSGPQMANRAGVTKAAVYQAERKEVAGEITIKQMQKMANALGGRFVYAVIPDVPSRTQNQETTLSVEALVRAHARAKAETIIGRASTHMALEKQALSHELNEAEIERLTEQLVRDLPSDFWEMP